MGSPCATPAGPWFRPLNQSEVWRLYCSSRAKELSPARRVSRYDPRSDCSYGHRADEPYRFRLDELNPLPGRKAQSSAPAQGPFCLSGYFAVSQMSGLMLGLEGPVRDFASASPVTTALKHVQFARSVHASASS